VYRATATLEIRVWVWINAVVRKLGSTEPFQGFDEGHLISVTHFYFLLHWAKMGFDKSLENYVRVRRVWKD